MIKFGEEYIVMKNSYSLQHSYSHIYYYRGCAKMNLKDFKGAIIDFNRTINDEDIKSISDTYHAWKGQGGDYEDIPGFCKSATLKEVRKHKHILTPGRYVGFIEEEINPEEFEKRIKELTGDLKEQFKKNRKFRKRNNF